MPAAVEAPPAPEHSLPPLARVRLFVGGLPPGQETALTARFAPFGRVAGVTVPDGKDMGDGATLRRGFAFVDLDPSDDRSLARCLATVRVGSVWRGVGGGGGAEGAGGAVCSRVMVGQLFRCRP